MHKVIAWRVGPRKRVPAGPGYGGVQQRRGQYRVSVAAGTRNGGRHGYISISRFMSGTGAYSAFGGTVAFTAEGLGFHV
jgi:hypothetical protein